MPSLNAVGIVASDMARSIRFYRLVGLDVPETPDEGHVEASLPNGFRLMLDTEDVVKSFRPDWTRSAGNQLSLAFECSSPAEVDEIYARVVAAVNVPATALAVFAPSIPCATATLVTSSATRPAEESISLRMDPPVVIPRGTMQVGHSAALKRR